MTDWIGLVATPAQRPPVGLGERVEGEGRGASGYERGVRQRNTLQTDEPRPSGVSGTNCFLYNLKISTRVIAARPRGGARVVRVLLENRPRPLAITACSRPRI